MRDAVSARDKHSTCTRWQRQWRGQQRRQWQQQKVSACALEQLEELAPLNEFIPVSVSCLVRAHQSRFVVEVWAVHGFADLAADDRFVDLSERETTVAVHINLMEELPASCLVWHDQLWHCCHSVQ